MNGEDTHLEQTSNYLLGGGGRDDGSLQSKSLIKAAKQYDINMDTIQAEISESPF